MVCLGQPGDGDPDDEDADRDVDQERQPPGDDRQRSAEHQAQHRTGRLHGGRHRERPVAGVTDGVGRRDQRQPRRRRDGRARALHRARDDQGDAVGGQAAHQRRDREHADAGQERPFVPDGVADAPADQQQAAEGQHVGGDDPALARVGEVEFGLQPRQRDDDDRAVERRHQLHTGDREDRDTENMRCQTLRGVVRRLAGTAFRRHGSPAYREVTTALDS